MKKLLFLFSLILIFSCTKEKIITEIVEKTNTITETVSIVSTNTVEVSLVVELDPIEIKKSNSTKVYAHYMPWFKSKTFSGYWGLHWTQANRNPDNFSEEAANINGLGIINYSKREIAAHFYPLIGPYDTADPFLQEYHFLLMKYSGIDGIIIDHPGAIELTLSDGLDERIEDVQSLIPSIERTGIEFSIMYEDRDIKYKYDEGRITDSTINQTIIQDLTLLDDYFAHPNYTKDDEKLLFTIFGPLFVNDPLNWNQIFASSEYSFDFLTLWGSYERVGDFAVGEYAWVFGGDNIDHIWHIDNFYKNTATRFNKSIGGIYPGFKDYYYEGGWDYSPDGIGWEIDHNNLSTLNACIELARQYSPDIVQLITWNDIQEGTMIEPTIEFGFSFIEAIADYTGSPYGLDEFVLIYNYYKKRKQFIDDDEKQVLLDQAFFLLTSLQVQKAIELMNSI